MNRSDISTLLARIENTFGSIPDPGDNLIAPGDRDLEKLRIARRFCGLHWSQVDTKLLADEPDALSFLSADAFRFFLPGYLILALRDPVGMDVALDSLLSALAGPVYFEERLGQLSQEQLRLILEVLDVLSPEGDSPDFWDFEHARRGILQILENDRLS